MVTGTCYRAKTPPDQQAGVGQALGKDRKDHVINESLGIEPGQGASRTWIVWALRMASLEIVGIVLMILGLIELC